jgi:multidrug efflux pump subunit AcrB
VAVLIVAGLASIAANPRTEDPRITNRFGIVITHLPGATVERVEAQVSEKIEDELRTLPEIKWVQSVSRPGISVVQILLKDHITETAKVWSRMRDLIGDVRERLPAEASDPTLDDDRGYAYTTLVGLKWKGEGKDLAILSRYAKELESQIRSVNGTDYVELYGEPQEEILVELDASSASAMKLSPAQVADRIRLSDSKVGAGELYNERNQIQIEVAGELDSVSRIEQIPVQIDGRSFTYRIGDLANVERGVQWPPSEIAMMDGESGIVVAIRMLPDLRVDRWTARIEEKLEAFQATLPENVEIEILFNQNDYTETRLGELLDNILIGFIIIAFVLWFTLGWRSALIVSASLPLTVLFTLACMNFYGLPIHQMSVTGLVVALGIMVDNAIVMADSIQQKRQQGMSAIDAVMDSVNHLWMPLLGSTMTTILAFMPIVMQPGPAGEFVGGIALSVIFSLIGSYLISHTLVAAMTGRFIRPISAEEQAKSHWYQTGFQSQIISGAFDQLLTAALKRPVITILLVSSLPMMGIWGAKQLTEQFFPPSDRDMFQIELYMPSQTSIFETQRVTEEIRDVLMAQTGIQHVRWFIGNDAPSFYYNLMPRHQGERNYAQAMITADNFDEANRLIPELQVLLDDRFPKAQILVRKLEQGPPFFAPIELRIYGPNLDQLKLLGEQARQILVHLEHVIHTRATLVPGTPKVQLNINEEASNQTGLSLTQVAGQLQGAFSGEVRGTVIESTESIPVRVRVSDDIRSSLSDLGNIQIVNPSPDVSQRPIPLTALADMTLEPSRGAILRRNGQRVNVVEGYLRAGILPATVLTEFDKRLQSGEFVLPAGYSMEFGGESAKRDDAVNNLMTFMGIILVLLVSTIVLSFNSFRLSAVILLSAIQAATLGLLCVYLIGFPFGFTVIIALLGLMGLAINAAIVILAELKADEKAAAGDVSAIKHGVQSCARHITSTTITTIGGFCPLIFGGGGFWPPFAVAIAGGTLLATLLAFFFVPACFLLFSRRRAFEVTGSQTSELAVSS